MRIAIDGMGGDAAPEVVVDGTLAAARRDPKSSYLVTGPKDRLEAEFKKRGGLPSCVTLEHASQVVEMNEHPVEALRNKRDNSIMRCVKLVLEGKADGLMSAGNTGAVVAASIFKLGLLEGVKRSGIMVPFPTEGGVTAIIDVGANINSRPINFVQYAIMGSAYIKISQNLSEDPKVGLLNIGEESEKGTENVQHAYQALKKFFGDRFIGNIEGHDLFSGKARVIVCDGFVGNVVLKMTEGFMGFMMKRLVVNGLPAEAKTKITDFAKHFDFSEYGGAPLLGVNGVVIIAHGRSDAKAIDKAIEATDNLCRQRLTEKIAQDIKSLSLWKRVSMWFGKEE
jgi:glycerol-3-phosphate acyltransferase PlsX